MTPTKLRAKICILLCAALLLGALAACQKDPGKVRPTVPPTPVGTVLDDPPDELDNTDEPDPEKIDMDTEHRLDIEYPTVPAGELELPVEGSTGYASVELPLWEQMPETASAAGTAEDEGVLMMLEPGAAFTVLQEMGSWWKVAAAEGEIGWVEHRYCLINLPDVIPSIIYNDTNAVSSLFITSGKDIPGITGEALYSCMEWNARLGRDEYLMPVLYSMARNICQAQQAALAEGNTLVLYEAYRPYDVQISVARAVQTLAGSDPVVKAGISTPPWSISWFIATGTSNHQQGYAIDVSLAKVLDARTAQQSGSLFVEVLEYENYTMPTQMHELSMAAATFTTAVEIFSTTAWKEAELTKAMSVNEPAKALQRYCTGANLTPLASEWWHFNDLNAYKQVSNNLSTGNYRITDCLSISAQLAQWMA